MKAHNIQWINTTSYSPQSNGMIENFTRQIRKMLREIMARNNSFVWYKYLDICCENRNTQRVSSIKRRPIDVWSATPYAAGSDRSENRFVRDNILKNAKRNVARNHTAEFEVGDRVRIKMSALFSDVRRMIKAHDKKYIVITYSPELYQITRILAPQRSHEYEKKRYFVALVTDNGLVPQLTQLKLNKPNRERREKEFFATDFQLVSSERSGDQPQVSIHDALKSNRMEDYEVGERQRVQLEPSPIVRSAPVPVAALDRHPRVHKPISRLNFVTLGGEILYL